MCCTDSSLDTAPPILDSMSVSVLTSTIQNTFGETRTDAQYIGDLNNRQTYRIDLTGSLVPRDKGDYYKFRVTANNTNIRLFSFEQTAGSGTTAANSSSTPQGTAANPLDTGNLTSLVDQGQLRYQLYTQTGKLVADSSPGSGNLFHAYQNLTSSTNMQLSTGTYTIKVSPGPNANPHTTYEYLFTLRGDGSPITDTSTDATRRAFDTTATAASNKDTTVTLGSAGNATILSTNAGVSESLFTTLQNSASGQTSGSTINLLA